MEKTERDKKLNQNVGFGIQLIWDELFHSVLTKGSDHIFMFQWTAEKKYLEI